MTPDGSVRKPLRRRQFLTSLALAGAATALAACAPAAPTAPTAAPAAKPTEAPKAAAVVPTSAPAAAQPTEAPKPTAAAAAKPADAGQQVFTYWIEFTDKLSNDVITEFINGPFEKQYPKHKVQMTQTPDYQRQIQTAASAGALPDAFNQFGPSYAPPLFDGGHLLDLTPLAKQFGWEQKIFGWILDSCKYKGKIACLPTEYETLHLFYNVDLFKKNNWTPPKSYAEILTLSKAQMDAKLIPFAFGSSGGLGSNEWWLSYALNAYAGNMALYEALTGAKQWTDDVYVGAIDNLNKLWQTGAIMSKQNAAITHADALGVWGKQDAVMIMDGTWRFRTISTFAKDFKWEAAVLPPWREGVRLAWPIGCGEVYCINAKARNMDAAVAYADWYFKDPKELGKWVTKVPGIYMPPIEMKKDDFAPGSDPILVDLYLKLIEAQKQSDFGFLLWSSWPAKTDKWMYENIDAVFLGQMTPKQFMEKMNATFQEELKGGAVPQQPKPKA